MRTLILQLVQILINIYEKFYVKDQEAARTIETLKLKKNLYMRRVKQVHRVIMDYEAEEIEDTVIEYEHDTDWMDLFPGVQSRMLSFPTIFIDKEVALVQMKDGAEIPIHRHSVSAEEIYVVSGRVVDTVTELESVSGEGYFIAKGSPHCIIAKEDACLVVIFSQ